MNPSFNMYIKILIIFLLFHYSSQDCNENCEICDEENQKCNSCKSGFYKIYGTDNCADKKIYPNYFIIYNFLHPCLLNCYECFFLEKSENYGCLSCKPGYIYNDTTKNCIPCDKGEYPITIENFDGWIDSFSQYCELYTTYCKPLENDKHEKVCEENNYNINDTCIISNNNYKILFINWIKEDFDYTSCPSYNNDKSDYLLIEINLSGNLLKSVRKKLFFYNEEGRGLFDEINDIHEKHCEYPRAYLRLLSSSIALKVTEEYRYLQILKIWIIILIL